MCACEPVASAEYFTADGCDGTARVESQVERISSASIVTPQRRTAYHYSLASTYTSVRCVGGVRANERRQLITFGASSTPATDKWKLWEMDRSSYTAMPEPILRMGFVDAGPNQKLSMLYRMIHLNSSWLHLLFSLPSVCIDSPTSSFSLTKEIQRLKSYGVIQTVPSRHQICRSIRF